MRRSSVLVLLITGCAASSTPAAAPREPQVAVALEAENPRWAKIAEEAAKGRTVAEQQRVAESEQHYQLALAWFNAGDFDKAKRQAQDAVQAWPDHLAARRLLEDVNDLVVGGATRLRGIGEQELRVARVRVEQARLEIENHLLQGRRLLDAGMPSAALREFENAEFKIRNMPYDLQSMNDLLPGLQQLKARARSSTRE